MGDGSEKCQFAIVRVPPSKRVHLFSLLLDNGYNEVTFTSELPTTTAAKTETASGSANDEPARVSSSSAAAAATPTVVSTSGQQLPTTPQQAKGNEDTYMTPISNSSDILNAMVEQKEEDDTNLQQHFSSPQHWIMPNGVVIPAATSVMQPMIVPGPPIEMPVRLMPGGIPGSIGSLDFAAGPSQSTRSMNYTGMDGSGRKVAFVERMKGWQRSMLNEAVRNGFPSGAELAELCARCQVTEIQAMRFFKKRKHGVSTGDAGYHEDDGDVMRSESPDMPLPQEPKREKME